MWGCRGCLKIGNPMVLPMVHHQLSIIWINLGVSTPFFRGETTLNHHLFCLKSPDFGPIPISGSPLKLHPSRPVLPHRWALEDSSTSLGPAARLLACSRWVCPVTEMCWALCTKKQHGKTLGINIDMATSPWHFGVFCPWGLFWQSTGSIKELLHISILNN